MARHDPIFSSASVVADTLAARAPPGVDCADINAAVAVASLATHGDLCRIRDSVKLRTEVTALKGALSGAEKPDKIRLLSWV